MTIPTHIAVNFGVFLVLQYVPNVSPSYIDLVLILGSNLIDLDHLFSKPIYNPKRNFFKSHFLHKQWKIVLAISVVGLFYRPVLFLCIGIILHLFLDYVYNKREKI